MKNRISDSMKFWMPLVTAMCVSVAMSQERSSVLDWEVIKNVRVEVGDGRALENASVLMADGVIRAIGNVQIPAGVKVTDGTGCTLYPGFIDAYFTKGLSLPEIVVDQDNKPDLSQTVLTSMRLANRKGTRPELKPEHYLELTDKILKPYHKNGFTSAVCSPTGVMMNGQCTLLDLTTAPHRDIVRASGVGSSFSFKTSNSGYPNSLLGVMAHIRQTLYDAKWYQKVAQIEGQAPHDEVLQALVPVVNAQVPMFFEAESALEIDRVLRIADEFDIRPVIVGGGEAYRRVDALAKRNVSVILSLNFSEEPNKPDENANELVVERYRLWEESVSNAALLEKAGIQFAFTTKDAKDVDQFMGNLRQAIKHGLSKEQALKALTINAATIVETKHLGVIEVGNAANLVLVKGDLLAETNEVISVYIGGIAREDSDSGADVKPENHQHHNEGCGCGHDG